MPTNVDDYPRCPGWARERESGLAVPRGSGLAPEWRRQNNTDELGRKEGNLRAEKGMGNVIPQSSLVSEEPNVAPHMCRGQLEEERL